MNPEPLLIDPPGGDRPYSRLVTHKVGLPSNSERTEAPEEVQRVRSYVQYVFDSGFCPYLRETERRNGYFISVNDAEPGAISPREEVFEMARQFEPHDRRVFTHADYSPTVLINAFSHPDAATPEFLEDLLEVRRDLRLRLMRQKKKFEIAHPERPVGGSHVERAKQDRQQEPLFQSEIPLIMMREFHRGDRVFMKTPQDIEAYNKHFKRPVRTGWQMD